MAAQRWEYRAFVIKYAEWEMDCNKLGKEGWELCHQAHGTTQPPVTPGAVPQLAAGLEVWLCYFKRPAGRRRQGKGR